MPRRPTKEFVARIRPSLKRQGYNKEQQGRVIGYAWKHLTPKKRREYERIRARREAR